MTHRLVTALRLRSLRVLLVLVVAACTILPLVGLGVFAWQRSEGDWVRNSGELLQSEARSTIDKIDRNLFERYGDVQAFAFNPDASADPATVAEAADFYSTNYVIYDLLLVVDRTGRVVGGNSVTGDGEPVGTSAYAGADLSSYPWFAEALALEPGQTYVQDPEVDPLVAAATGRDDATLVFAAPVYGPDGSVQRLWVNWASVPRVIGQILDEQVAGLAGRGLDVTAQLLRSDGQVLVGPGAGGSLDLAAAGLPAAAALVDGESGHGTDDLADGTGDGVEKVRGWSASQGALGFAGYGWGVVLSEELADAVAPASSLLRAVLLLALVVAVVVTAVALLVARALTRPLDRAVDALEQVADGDLRPRLPESGTDEVRTLAQALNRSLEKVAGALSALRERTGDLSGASDRLRDLSDDVARDAARGTEVAGRARAATDVVSENVRTVAAGAEEMGASIREIAHSTSEAARVGGSAVEAARETTATVARLGDSSRQIGEVVSVITAIAEQTNLLALNATIEAARAGEAGKGFAVVAGEVKDLAAQTQQATEDITRRVDAIQADTAGAAAAISGIAGIVEQVNDFQQTIASAVEEQSATTAEMSRNVAQAAHGTEGVSDDVRSVAEATASTATSTESTRGTAADLARITEELRGLVARFQLP
ncbi:methyl-accepting chemotaxis protein [Modestobacter roseus]|uniref:Methyl-accepting chemotaxis sensory transducer with Cache sensor n=1 Tax=Modestobacter roseus TaxID=1181884 RepID=A0A562IMU6_9ACTN|nr:methyl-accepting chemotaxis protein [Modestobacter roseus]TWH72166.1 methyl-accepting chemotaxis sensory transducer with Cache sensor [Modestobacter roseus]